MTGARAWPMVADVSTLWSDHPLPDLPAAIAALRATGHAGTVAADYMPRGDKNAGPGRVGAACGRGRQAC